MTFRNTASNIGGGIAGAYRSAWSKAKATYHLVAFLSLMFVVFSVFTGRSSGYLQFTAPLGNAIGTVSGDKLTHDAEQPAKEKAAKTEKHADAAPLPGNNPFKSIPIPPTPDMVR
jgi:hypothetical protein